MAPRFAFRASKFRNIECKPVPREAAYDQLQVTSAAVDGNVLAATRDRLAFAHQIDGGAAIQVKDLADTGKETAAIPPLLRGHHARVNALEFSPFEPQVLFSASADTTVKVWTLPSTLRELENGTSAAATLSSISTARPTSVTSIKHHPSASGVLAAVTHRETLVFDVAAETAVYHAELDESSDDAFSSVTWNYEGSLLLASTHTQQVRLLDPRAPVVQEFTAHSGRRRPTSVVWCGHRDRFLTTGCDNMQERELKLWDPRYLAAPVHRERLDANIGQLFPLVDADVDLLYVLGRGDRSVRVFEVDDGGIHKLTQALLPHTTLGATTLRKQSCDTQACEVARVLSLSATSSTCDVLSVTVPRRDSEFQHDLYPPTTAFEPALTCAQWWSGDNAIPVLEQIKPTVDKPLHDVGDDGGRSGVFGASTSQPVVTSVAPSQPAATNGWGAAAASPWASTSTNAWGSTPTAPPSSTSSSTALSGWASKTTAWNAPAAAPPSSSSSASSLSSSRPVQWIIPEVIEMRVTTTQEEDEHSARRRSPSSDKIARFTNAQGHKLKYIKGTLAPRLDALVLDDHATAAPSASLRVNDSYLALPVVGAGGPVLVAPVSASGKASANARVLNGHKAAVTDVAFAPFAPHTLATGSSDTTIALWSLNASDDAVPSAVLRGHTKTVRSVEFHPLASDVLCSTSVDRSVRLWDVAAQQEQVCLADCLEEPVWNAAFSPDGALLATSSRARLVRLLDPRAATNGHALVALGCGFDAKRPQYVAWLSPERLLTVGTNGQQPQLRVWDARQLVDPLSVTPLAIDAADADLVPLYDASSRLLMLAAIGSRSLWSLEVSSSDETVQTNLPFVLGDDSATIASAALLPPQLCDVKSIELAKVLVLRSGGSRVDRVSFKVPRHASLSPFFQDDLYGELPSRRRGAPLTSTQWFSGENGALEMESRCPPDMTPLSQRPMDTEDKNRVPMSQVFKQRWEQETREQREKEANLARLQALAAQPSLHAVHQRVASTATDSDDDWDD